MAAFVVSVIALVISAIAIGVSFSGNRSRDSLTREQLKIQGDVRDLQKELAELQKRKFEREEADANAAAGAAFEASLSGAGSRKFGLRIHNIGKAPAESLKMTFWQNASVGIIGRYSPSEEVVILSPNGISEIEFEYKGTRPAFPITVEINWREGGKSRNAKASFHELGANHVKFY